MEAVLQRSAVLDQHSDQGLGHGQNLLKQSLLLMPTAIAAGGGSVNPMLQLDDLISRLLVLLMLPQLLDGDDAGLNRAANRGRD
ncbi:MAG: hypothetical protein NTY67_11425 [Cyanobacteria bacterium]|nr:hypothetical protein [Cyanobacteriota bacterium]